MQTGDIEKRILAHLDTLDSSIITLKDHHAKVSGKPIALVQDPAYRDLMQSRSMSLLALSNTKAVRYTK